MDKAKIGIFGGSGFYKLFAEGEGKFENEYLNFPFGQPSSPPVLGQISGRDVAFIARHGKEHRIPPHKIPNKANIDCFNQLGVERILGPCAAGSLQPEVKPGDFVIADQLIDMTHGRDDTFFHGPEVAHVSIAEPYCPEMRKVAIEACESLGISYHPKGTVVVINGPRFATKAESKFYSNQGWEVINMTQYPECVLAREKEMCYLNISLITDYDAGLEGHPEVKAVSAADVGKIFQENNEKVKKLIAEVIKNLSERGCGCGNAMKDAFI
jgi:5'-methylthioadenosine phosphorylase